MTAHPSPRLDLTQRHRDKHGKSNRQAWKVTQFYKSILLHRRKYLHLKKRKHFLKRGFHVWACVRKMWQHPWPGGLMVLQGKNDTCNSGEWIQVSAGSIHILRARQVGKRSPHIHLRSLFTDKISNALWKSQVSKTWIKLNPRNQRGAAYDLTPKTEGSLRATVRAAFEYLGKKFGRQQSLPIIPFQSLKGGNINLKCELFAGEKLFFYIAITTIGNFNH